MECRQRGAIPASPVILKVCVFFGSAAFACYSEVRPQAVAEEPRSPSLQLDYITIGIDHVCERKLAAVLAARDQLAARSFDLLDHPIVIVDVQLEAEVLNSARHPDRFLRSNLVQCK